MSRHLLIRDRNSSLDEKFVSSAERSGLFRSVRRLESDESTIDYVESTDGPLAVLLSGKPDEQFFQLAHDVPVLRVDKRWDTDEPDPDDPFLYRNLATNSTPPDWSSLARNIEDVWNERTRLNETRRELEEARRLFAVLAETSQEGILLSRNGQILFANKIGGDILGATPDELAERNFFDFVEEPWMSRVANRVRSGDHAVYSFLARRADGSSVPIRVHGRTLHLDHNSFRITSLTELSREDPLPFADDWSDEELYGSEAPLVWLGISGKVLYANSHLLEALDYTSEQISSLHVWDFDDQLTPESWDSFVASLRRQSILQHRTRIIKSHGERFPVLVHARHRQLDDLEYVSGTFDDLTREVEAYRAEERSRHRLSLALEAATIGLFEWNTDTNSFSGSSELEAILGYDRGQMPDRFRLGMFNVRTSDVRNIVHVVDRAVREETHFNFDCKVIRGPADWSWLKCWGDVHRDPASGEKILVGAALDVTEQRQRHREIELERERFRAFVDGSLDAFFLMEAACSESENQDDFRVAYSNPVAERLLDVSASELHGSSMRETDSLLSLDEIVGMVADSYESGNAVERELETQIPGEMRRWFRVQIVPYSEGAGLVLRDITGQKKRSSELRAYREELEVRVAERTEELRRSEAQFRSVVESAHDILLIVDRELKYIFVNRAAQESTPNDLIGTEIGRFVTQDRREAFENAILAVFKSGDSRRTQIPVEWVDGSELWFDCNMTPVVGPGSVEAVTIVARDITEQRQAVREIENLNRELEVRVDERTSELKALLSTSHRLAALLREEAVLDVVVETLVSLLPDLASAVIWSIDEDEGVCTAVARGGPDVNEDHTSTVELNQPLIQNILAAEGAFNIGASKENKDELASLTLTRESASVLAASFLRRRGRCYVVVVSRKDSESDFTGTEKRIVSSLAAQATVSLENAHLFREIRSMSLRLLHVQEKERRAVAQELHDEVGGLLTSLQLCLKLSVMPNEDLPDATAEAVDMVESLIQEVRSLSLRLRPMLLDDYGLIPALDSLIERQAQTTVDLDYSFDREMRFDSSIETTAYRVIQEALTNVARHADTDKVSITLDVSDNRLSGVIEDEGCGFDVEAALDRQTSIGVRGMLERVELLRGEAELTSDPGHGTSILFWLPLDYIEPTGGK